MNKQQNKTWDDCMALLMSELPKEDAEAVYDKAVLKWQDFSARMNGESERRKKLAINSILPRIAIYAALKEDGHPPEASNFVAGMSPRRRDIVIVSAPPAFCMRRNPKKPGYPRPISFHRISARIPGLRRSL